MYVMRPELPKSREAELDHLIEGLLRKIFVGTASSSEKVTYESLSEERANLMRPNYQYRPEILIGDGMKRKTG